VEPCAHGVMLRSVMPLLGFAGYAIVVWCSPLPDATLIEQVRSGDPVINRESVSAWRSAGCQFCHSIQGLGGHIGPDLTNVVSRTSDGYIRAMLLAGPPGMPSYADLDEDSISHIIRYLESMDGSGRFPADAWWRSFVGRTR
jgi:hypothetical protein